MASSGVNVLRYSALLAGIAYGFSHQASITAKSKLNHIEAETKHHESLIQKGKAEWAKKMAPPEGVITDPANPMFDLESLVAKVADGSVQV